MSGIVNRIGSISGKIWSGLSRAEIPTEVPAPGASGKILKIFPKEVCSN